jgi:hypothetical protein
LAGARCWSAPGQLVLKQAGEKQNAFAVKYKGFGRKKPNISFTGAEWERQRQARILFSYYGPFL